jgi:hypothetical protein
LAQGSRQSLSKLAILRLQRQDIAVEKALERFGRKPGWPQTQIELVQADADKDRVRSDASGSVSPWRAALRHYMRVTEAWLGLVTDSQGTRDFYTILPIIVANLYRQFFHGITPENFRPVSGEAHQFQTELAALERDFRKRAAEQAFAAAGVSASPRDSDDCAGRANLETEMVEQITIAGADAVRKIAKKGRRANLERREAIRKAIEREDWRDHLGEVFTELDHQEVPLGHFQSMKIDLGDSQSTRVSKWDDLEFAQGAQRQQIIDRLRKYSRGRI